MELFLQIIGGIVVSIVLLVIVVFLYFKIKFGKYLNANTDQPPLHIHLNEDIEPEWLSKSDVKKVVSELDQLGFSSGKAYFIHEMDGYLLKVFYKSPVVAVMYWHEIASCWVDMVVEEVEGTEYTVSNAPMGSEMSQRPECVKEYEVSAKVPELYSRISTIAKGSSKDFVEVSAENFRMYFESAFKKDIAWKNRNGGISYEEFIATEKKERQFKSFKKDIEEAFIVTKEGELYQWHEAAMEEYCQKENIKEEDFYDMDDMLVAVPFTSNAAAFIRYLSNYSFVSQKQEEQLTKAYSEETDMHKLFNTINELLSPDLRASFVMDIDYPLPIKLYKLSDNMDD